MLKESLSLCLSLQWRQLIYIVTLKITGEIRTLMLCFCPLTIKVRQASVLEKAILSHSTFFNREELTTSCLSLVFPNSPGLRLLEAHLPATLVQGRKQLQAQRNFNSPQFWLVQKNSPTFWYRPQWKFLCMPSHRPPLCTPQQQVRAWEGLCPALGWSVQLSVCSRTDNYLLRPWEAVSIVPGAGSCSMCSKSPARGRRAQSRSSTLFFVKDPIKYFQLLPSLSQGLNSGCSVKAAVDPR